MKSKNIRTQSKPIIAITMGDPAGIGPEVALKALSLDTVSKICRAFIIGDISVLAATQKQVKKTLPIREITSPDDILPGYCNVLSLNVISPTEFTTGKISKKCGKAAFAYIDKSITLALKKQIAAVVTCPINKEALHRAGFHYPGHTEIFAEKTKTKKYSMMFSLDNVCVAHVTTHCSLKKAIAQVTTKRVLEHIQLLNDVLTKLYKKKMPIAVGGINPHAGENGLFGNEEIKHIIPAIQAAKKMKIPVSGPYPPDTVFMRAFSGEFVGVVAMLHDHGFTALKSRNFDDGVNITIGLPIIRTSVGHGTAFDIAGKGVASEKSLVEAIEAAVRLCSE